ncbi:MAG: carbamoyltransferase HypF [Desulfomonilaceae bacterium]|nr:carbamoyltransferase HypF [Desulfomonilaceae bacterium]
MKSENTDWNPIEPSPPGKVRKHLVLTGVLQGIGCRPTVYRLATQLELAGWVINTAGGVRIEIEGSPEQCNRFLTILPQAIPSPGRIDTTSEQSIPPLGETSFRIDESLGGERTITPIPPDTAVCSECVRELLDPTNHRFLYPFTTCTLCGPRFTVVRSFPYDRERTSMADFTMCPRCMEEYATPIDRRFHSQTNSCPRCGPTLQLIDASGKSLEGDPIEETIRLLNEGKTIAVKGIGGFHLACDALNDDAVRRLRDRKGRAEKPFAVMMPDVTTVRRFCVVSEAEESLLVSPVAPIVLLESAGAQVGAGVAPDMGTLGIMLPYTPVHHLFFRHPGVPADARSTALVMTSGNRSEEPIVRDNQEALVRLGGLADAFLLHDREIVLRADDSIFRVIAGRKTVFRRSRGMVPGELKISSDDLLSKDDAPARKLPVDTGNSRADLRDLVILGAGGDLKNSQAVVKGDQVVPGPHVGDLASPTAQEYFIQSAGVLADYLEAVPDVVAVDPHPEYFSSGLAGEMDAVVEEVYHHHAHAVSLLCEHGLSGPALFAVFDGTGYGTDGTIWGGEFLVADRETFRRAGRIGAFPLPGGEAAIREPVRILAGLLGLAAGGNIAAQYNSLLGISGDRAALWLEAAAKGINSPLTSSAGRLFDAAAAAAGFRRAVTFEGQAAMWLEGIADSSVTDAYPVRLTKDDPLVMEPAPLILEVIQDIVHGTSPGRVSARFHNSMAECIATTAGELAARTGLSTVGLTGGCFQNRFLTERSLALLEQRGFRVLLHETIPPNDGGIAVGQAVAARARRGYSQ